MFCQKCGKEINDSAAFCSQCGTAVLSTSQLDINHVSKSTNNHSEFYPILCERSHKITTYYVFSLISLITCMGVGLIFSIIAYVIGRKVPPFTHADMLTNPEEIHIYNNSERKFKTSGLLCLLGGGINLVMWSLAFLLIYIASI